MRAVLYSVDNYNERVELAGLTHNQYPNETTIELTSLGYTVQVTLSLAELQDMVSETIMREGGLKYMAVDENTIQRQKERIAVLETELQQMRSGWEESSVAWGETNAHLTKQLQDLNEHVSGLRTYRLWAKLQIEDLANRIVTIDGELQTIMQQMADIYGC